MFLDPYMERRITDRTMFRRRRQINDLVRLAQGDTRRLKRATRRKWHRTVRQDGRAQCARGLEDFDLEECEMAQERYAWRFVD